MLTLYGAASLDQKIYRIVYNESLRRLNEKSRERLHLDRDNGVPSNSVPLDEDAFEKISREEEQKLVNEAMEKLNPNEHLVLSLFYPGEKSINEIARITGFTKSNVRVLMQALFIVLGVVFVYAIYTLLAEFLESRGGLNGSH